MRGILNHEETKRNPPAYSLPTAQGGKRGILFKLQSLCADSPTPTVPFQCAAEYQAKSLRAFVESRMFFRFSTRVVTPLVWLSFLLLGASPVLADSPRSAAARGVKHYGKEEYDKALTEFLAGLDKSPDRPELRYDLGAALYRLQQFPQAAEAFNKAAAKKNPKVAGDAWFNLGNALFNAQKFDDAVKAYKNALLLKHDDQDAKHNLELALRARQVQQQQQQSGQDSTRQQQQQQQQGQQQQQQQQQDKEKQQEQQQAQAAQDSSGAPPDSAQQQQMEQQGPMSREEAMQLLQALEGDEQEAQKEKLIRQFGQPKQVEKDW